MLIESFFWAQPVSVNSGQPHKIALEDETDPYTRIDQSVEVEPKTYRFHLQLPFLSLGQSRHYYAQLIDLVPDSDIRDSLFSTLHDVIWLEMRKPNHPDLRLRELKVFTVSLLRSAGAVAVLGEGKFIIFPDELREHRFNFSIDVRLPNRADPLKFEFAFERGLSPFPTTMAVIVGRNGLGKTQSLYAIQRKLCPEIELGESAERQPPFKAVVVVSYSLFEKFPAQSKEALGGRPKYVYCGFRNIDGAWNSDFGLSIGRAITRMAKDRLGERNRNRPRLASFRRALMDGLGTKDIKLHRYRGAIDPVNIDTWDSEHGPAEEELDQFPVGIEHLQFDEISYENLSAGQKMFVLIAANLCSAIEPESLIILDEPELYLHPNLECAYVGMLRTILGYFESYAVIATHSLFIVREVPERCVHVLKETELNEVLVTTPSIRTFGGDLNLIADYVFNNVGAQKYYTKRLDEIASESGSYEAIRERYGDRLGFDALSYLRQKLDSNS